MPGVLETDGFWTGVFVVVVFGVIFGFAGTAFLTVTLHLYFLPFAVAVIVVVPGFLAFTFPLALTEATFFFEEVHLIFALFFFNFNL